MRKMKRLLFVVLMSACSVSWGKWELTDTDEDRTVSYYHDKLSIQRSKSKSKMSILNDFSSEQISSFSGIRYKSSKAIHVYDCESFSVAVASLTWYAGNMGRGKVVYSNVNEESDFRWYRILKSTVDYKDLETACMKK